MIVSSEGATGHIVHAESSRRGAGVGGTNHRGTEGTEKGSKTVSETSIHTAPGGPRGFSLAQKLPPPSVPPEYAATKLCALLLR